MSRRLILLLAVVVALFTIAPAVGAGNANGAFTASLSGDNEVPPNDSKGAGVAILKFRGESLQFKLIATNLKAPAAAAHIHCGAVGANGPVGVTLYPLGEDPPGAILSQGSIAAPDTGNACGWADLNAVKAAIENDMAYVNVHTSAHPGGEIRGQVG